MPAASPANSVPGTFVVAGRSEFGSRHLCLPACLIEVIVGAVLGVQR